MYHKSRYKSVRAEKSIIFVIFCCREYFFLNLFRNRRVRCDFVAKHRDLSRNRTACADSRGKLLRRHKKSVISEYNAVLRAVRVKAQLAAVLYRQYGISVFLNSIAESFQNKGYRRIKAPVLNKRSRLFFRFINGIAHIVHVPLRTSAAQNNSILRNILNRFFVKPGMSKDCSRRSRMIYRIRRRNRLLRVVGERRAHLIHRAVKPCGCVRILQYRCRYSCFKRLSVLVYRV